MIQYFYMGQNIINILQVSLFIVVFLGVLFAYQNDSFFRTENEIDVVEQTASTTKDTVEVTDVAEKTAPTTKDTVEVTDVEEQIASTTKDTVEVTDVVEKTAPTTKDAVDTTPKVTTTLKKEVPNQVTGVLSYTSLSNAVDPNKRKYGVNIEYTATPQCNPFDAIGYIVETGDGYVFPADCKGVFEHEYKVSGKYTVKYLHNGVVLDSLIIKVPL